MARKKPNGNPNWVKGHVANPHGRPPDALNAAMKKITKDELEEIATIIIKGDYQTLEDISNDKTQSGIRYMIARACVGIAQDRDMNGLDKLLNRLIGKVKDSIDVNNIGNIPTTVVLNIPDNGRAAPKPDDE